MRKLQFIEVGMKTPSRPIGVLLHGFGSCAEDIAPLCNIFLDLVPYWLVLQAPVPMEQLLGYPDPSYAWFPKKNDGLSNNPTISWHDLENYDMPDVVEAALLVEKTLRDRHVFSSQVVLAGFSQGGMIATEVVLQRTLAISKKLHTNNEEKNNFAVLLLFSSAFLARNRRTALLEKAHTSDNFTLPSVMVSHGKSDEVLLYEQGRILHEFWKRYIPHAEFYTFDGGHEITNKVCEHAATFLQQSLTIHQWN